MIRIGYAPGAFDLFHIGHLNLLRNARTQRDYLIVGVVTDASLELSKGTRPIVPLEERLEIPKHRWRRQSGRPRRAPQDRHVATPALRCPVQGRRTGAAPKREFASSATSLQWAWRSSTCPEHQWSRALLGAPR